MRLLVHAVHRLPVVLRAVRIDHTAPILLPLLLLPVRVHCLLEGVGLVRARVGVRIRVRVRARVGVRVRVRARARAMARVRVKVMVRVSRICIVFAPGEAHRSSTYHMARVRARARVRVRG